MANLSDAYGTFFIYANDEKVIDDLNKAIHYIGSDYTDYYTNLIKAHDLSKNEKTPYKFLRLFEFEGQGRWDYAKNIEYFGAWLETALEKHDPQLLARLIARDFMIEIDYKDKEVNMGLDEEDFAVIEHISGTNLSDSKITWTDEFNYDEIAKEVNGIVETITDVDRDLEK